MQVQKLKVDMESAMLEMDQILKSNELSIALVAAIPALLVAGAVIALIVRWLRPRPPDPVFEALPCRWGSQCGGRRDEERDTEGIGVGVAEEMWRHK